MEENKIIAALVAFLSAIFWHWLKGVENKHNKLEEKHEELKDNFKNYVSKDDFLREMKELKILIKDLQKDINRVRFEEKI